MKFRAVSFSAVLVSSLIGISLAVQAPSGAQQPTASPANVPTNWSQATKTQGEFMQGCTGSQPLTAAQRRAKENFCRCAFGAYKARYTPQTFLQINSLALKLGAEGPRLVSLMMKPDLDRCSTQTGYSRS